jgi:sigma-E factor negative regulatory protein RseC
MRTIDCITQEGVVNEINNGVLKVTTLSKSLCATCHSKSTCTSLDNQQKEYLFDTFDPCIKKGDKVLVRMRKNLGPLAVFLGYILPFLIFISLLITISEVTKRDLYAAAIALISIALYYIILKLFSEKLRSTFTFEVEKYDD